AMHLLDHLLPRVRPNVRPARPMGKEISGARTITGGRRSPGDDDHRGTPITGTRARRPGPVRSVARSGRWPAPAAVPFRAVVRPGRLAHTVAWAHTTRPLRSSVVPSEKSRGRPGTPLSSQNVNGPLPSAVE